MEYNEIDKRLLLNLSNTGTRKELFKKFVDMVEIEVFSFCNRKCWFCPNSKIDRFSKNEHLDEKVYLKLLDELMEVNYDKAISYSRYNEPLADKIILKRLRQAREKLPNSYLHMNTNGDYLTKEYLEKLHEAGLSSINIQSYLKKDEVYDYQIEKEKVKKIQENLQLEIVAEYTKENEWCQLDLNYKDMIVKIYSRNFNVNGCDRGGTVDIGEKYERISPCLTPFRSIYIDYNGETMPCCNLRSDFLGHEKFSAGNIENMTIFELYNNQHKIREKVYGISKKILPCDTCTFVPIDVGIEEENYYKKLKRQVLIEKIKNKLRLG